MNRIGVINVEGRLRKYEDRGRGEQIILDSPRKLRVVPPLAKMLILDGDGHRIEPQNYITFIFYQ